MKKLLLWRRLCQIFILLFFIVVPILNMYGIHEMYGNLLSFHFFGLQLCDPLSALQVCMRIVLSGSEVLSSTTVTSQLPSEMLWGAFFVLCIAFLLGPIFCSWICPYGFLSELVWSMRGKKAQQAKQQDNKKMSQAQSHDRVHGIVQGAEYDIAPNIAYDITYDTIQKKSSKKDTEQEIGQKIEQETGTKLTWIRLFTKEILFYVLLITVVLFSDNPSINQLSMPAWYTRIWQYVFLYGQVLCIPLVFMFVVLACELFLKQRFWCTYICPQSVLLTFFGAILPMRLRVKFNQKSCTCSAKERACIKVCSLNLNPRNLVGADKIACTNCGDCVATCDKVCKAKENALHLSAFGWLSNTRQKSKK